jgi:Fe2+ transport system protein FeoA
LNGARRRLVELGFVSGSGTPIRIVARQTTAATAFGTTIARFPSAIP